MAKGTIKYCLCGCGQSIEIKKHHKYQGIPDYIWGHNARYNHPMKDKKHSEESKIKMHIAHKNIPLSEMHKKNIGKASKKSWDRLDENQHKERHSKMFKPFNGCSPMKNRTHTELSKLKNSQSNKGKRRSPNTEFTSESMREKYKDEEYIKKMKKAWNIKPNKSELRLLNFLNKLFPHQWKYVGDFSFTIDGKCPDFINVNGQKKIIELFGDYWHQGENPQDRIDIFKPFGYDTLVIWEHELKNKTELKSKLETFCLSHEQMACNIGGAQYGW